MAIQPSAGSCLSISATQPATNDLAGFDTLTYTQIGEITNLGEFGREYEVIEHKPLKSRATEKRKGGYNEGQLTLELAYDRDDAGQQLAIAARDSDDSYSFEIMLNNGEKHFFSGQITTYKINVGTSGDLVKASVTVEIDGNTFYKAP